jgi:hypothetical protein
MGIAEKISQPPSGLPRTQAADNGYLEGLSPRAGGIHKGAKALRRLRVSGDPSEATKRKVRHSINKLCLASNSRQSLKACL